MILFRYKANREVVNFCCNCKCYGHFFDSTFNAMNTFAIVKLLFFYRLNKGMSVDFLHSLCVIYIQSEKVSKVLVFYFVYQYTMLKCFIKNAQIFRKLIHKNNMLLHIILYFEVFIIYWYLVFIFSSKVKGFYQTAPLLTDSEKRSGLIRNP